MCSPAPDRVASELTGRYQALSQLAQRRLAVIIKATEDAKQPEWGIGTSDEERAHQARALLPRADENRAGGIRHHKETQ
jgi:hypothetical protein